MNTVMTSLITVRLMTKMFLQKRLKRLSKKKQPPLTHDITPKKVKIQNAHIFNRSYDMRLLLFRGVEQHFTSSDSKL